VLKFDAPYLYIESMHPDDLKVVWTCRECESRFIFHTDINDHIQLTGHSKVQKNDLLSGKLIAVDV
jgi:hypothetical protein